MSQDNRGSVLEKLDKKIGDAKSLREKEELQDKPTPGAAYAFRLTTEMAAALLVGLGIGWLIDGWLGTSPWGLLVFLFVGFVAGILNAYRTARRVAGF